MMNYVKGLGLGVLCVVMFALGVAFNAYFIKGRGAANSGAAATSDNLSADSGAEIISGVGTANSKTSQSPIKSGFSFSVELQSATTLLPDSFVSYPRFSASRLLSTKVALSAEDKAAVASTFNAIIARVGVEKLCTGGSYTIEPTFSYKDGLETPKGQRVQANLSCKIKQDELEKYNALMGDIADIAARSGLITMSMPALRASFSGDSLRQNDDKLREMLIKSALDKASEYASTTHKACELTALDFARGFVGARLMGAREEAANTAAADTALPVVDEEERTMSAVATYLCR